MYINNLVITFGPFHIKTIYLSSPHLHCNCVNGPNHVIYVAFPSLIKIQSRIGFTFCHPVSLVCFKRKQFQSHYFFQAVHNFEEYSLIFINSMFLILGLFLVLHVEFRLYTPVINEMSVTSALLRASPLQWGTRPLSVTHRLMLSTWPSCCQISPLQNQLFPLHPHPTSGPLLHHLQLIINLWGDTTLGPCRYHALYQLSLESASVNGFWWNQFLPGWLQKVIIFHSSTSALATWHSAFYYKQEPMCSSGNVCIIGMGRWFPTFLRSSIYFCP